ncbi:MAG: hypothetical protein HXX18_01970 [Bacteroidetes bacterium]|nr:hypothetical protein [Bacteroidota bacterium]
MKRTIHLGFLLLKLKAKFIFLVSLILTFFLFSCVKEGDFEFDKLASNQYNPTIAAPFVSSRLTLKDIINDTSGIIQVNSSDNSIKLVYSTNKLVSIMAKDLFKIPNQSIQTDSSNLVLTVPSGDSNYYSIIKPYSFILPASGQRVDSVFIKNATLKVKVNTDINHKGRIKLTIPNIKRPDGQDFSIEEPVDPTGLSTPFTHVILPINLSGCKIIFNNAPGHNNEVVFKYEHWLYKDALPYNNPYFIHLNDTLENISYDKLFGYIGQQVFPLKDTLNFDIFNNQLSGQFEFNTVTVGIKTLNSYGLPIEAKIDKFQAKNGSAVVDVTDFPTQNPFNLNYPTINQVGQTVETNIANQPSTHLANAINISPKTIIYNVNGKANPANNPGIQNFVLDTSKFTVAVQIELPLEGKVGGFVLQDTLDFDLKNIKDLEEATFRINTWNAFPLGAKVQVYFTDIFYNKLDSLVTNVQNEIITAGQINPITHMVSSPSFCFNEFLMIKSRLLKIENAKKILIKAILSTPSYPSQLVKISNNDYLDVKLGVKVKTIINTK